jgi:hypothetical protein
MSRKTMKLLVQINLEKKVYSTGLDNLSLVYRSYWFSPVWRSRKDSDHVGLNIIRVIPVITSAK